MLKLAVFRIAGRVIHSYERKATTNSDRFRRFDCVLDNLSRLGHSRPILLVAPLKTDSDYKH